MENWRKILCLLLSMVMMLSLLPTWAIAEETETVELTAEIDAENDTENLITEEEEMTPEAEEALDVDTEAETAEVDAEAVEEFSDADAVTEPEEFFAEEAISPAVNAVEEAVPEEIAVEPAAEETAEEPDLPVGFDALFPDSTGGVTQAQAVAWAEAQIGKSLDYDGSYGCQCVDLIYYYYQALGQTVLGGDAIDYASNALPAGWQRITYGNGVTAQPGDIAVWSGWDNAYGHVAIVHSADSTAMNVIEQNFNYVTSVQKNWTDYSSSISGRRATLVCFIRPDFVTNQPPKGNVDEIYGTSNGTIYIRGWAFDPDDTGNNSLELDVYTTKDGYSGGNRYVTYCNGKYRPDVVNVYGNVGNYHGFELEVPVNERGNQPVYIYAIDTSNPHSNTLIYNGGIVNINKTYTVNYDANGGTGAPASQIITEGSTMTIRKDIPTRSDTTETITYTLRAYDADGQASDNIITTTKTTTYTFKNWNTASDGSGTSYNAGASYYGNQSATLYAQWTTATSTTPVNLPTPPSRDGCTFMYWQDTVYYPYRTYTDSCNYFRSTRFVAMWEMTLHYDANGGTGAPADEVTIIGNQYTKNVSATVPSRADENGSYVVVVDTNGGDIPGNAFYSNWSAKYTFKNWNTAADGSGSSYSSGDSITATSSVTLYAQWDAEQTTASLTFPTPTRSGYSFVGWGTSASDTSGFTGSYTPTGDVTLYAIWKSDSPVSQTEFDDVADPSAYYYNAVYWAAGQGITSGTSPTTFSPGRECTRGQIVTFLWKAMGSPEPSTTDNPFTDVKPGDYFYKPVLWAKENKITSGTSATTFSPGNPCTRGQIVTFLWIASGRPWPSTLINPFSDVDESDYFFVAVLWAKDKGITSGTSATTFSPGNTCTRAQAMTFLWNAFGKS